MRIGPLVAFCLTLLSSQALADRVVLLDGAVIEGKATRQGRKVLVVLGSGQISLDAAIVVKIEKSRSDVDHYDELRAKLPPRDIRATLALANYCRDHDMRAREQELLKHVLEIDANHSEARARLGYVKGEHGWVTFDEAQRQKGLVRHDGQWVTREEQMRLVRLSAETRAAELAVHRERLALEAKELELAAQRARMAREQAAGTVNDDDRDDDDDDYPFWMAPFAYMGWCQGGGCRPVAPAAPQRPPFINGASDPRNQGWNTPGTRSPQSYF
jgi:hypothetical protein